MCVLCFAMILMHLEVPELPRMDANVTCALRFAMHIIHLEVPELTKANRKWGNSYVDHVLTYGFVVDVFLPHNIRMITCRKIELVLGVARKLFAKELKLLGASS